MEYTSTRNSARRLKGAQAIVTGLSPDGGLFVPVNIGAMNMKALMGNSYEEIALAVFKHFLPEYKEFYLKEDINAAYGENFSGKAGLLKNVDNDFYSLELWHGPTAAFKDYALQIMPKLLCRAKQMIGEKQTTLILVATSGDTGSAALDGYSDLEGIEIAAFYPQNGTSEIQRLQMVTQSGKNVAVYGIKGNFDDAQKGVKKAFCSEELAEKLLKKGIKLSSANSINWGRLCPQIVYYISTYLSLCQNGTLTYGEELDFCVPTGNFGDIMAGWYAKQLGLPIGKLICAANKNNVLADFFESGTYSSKREFYQTSSPSMDILVSSNLERLLYHVSADATRVRKWMEQLAAKGEYSVEEDVMQKLRKDFQAGWASEDEVSEQIFEIYKNNAYLCDPHTAVAFAVAKCSKRSNVPMVVVSTASPFKFCKKVLRALGEETPQNEFEAMAWLEKTTKEKAPQSLSALQGKEQRFNNLIEPEQIQDIPLEIQNLLKLI